MAYTNAGRRWEQGQRGRRGGILHLHLMQPNVSVAVLLSASQHSMHLRIVFAVPCASWFLSCFVLE